MVLIAQIALGVTIGGLTLALLATGFIMWMQDRGRKRLAVGLFVTGAVIALVLVAVVAVQ